MTYHERQQELLRRQRMNRIERGPSPIEQQDRSRHNSRSGPRTARNYVVDIPSNPFLHEPHRRRQSSGGHIGGYTSDNDRRRDNHRSRSPTTRPGESRREWEARYQDYLNVRHSDVREQVDATIRELERQNREDQRRRERERERHHHPDRARSRSQERGRNPSRTRRPSRTQTQAQPQASQRSRDRERGRSMAQLEGRTTPPHGWENRVHGPTRRDLCRGRGVTIDWNNHDRSDFARWRREWGDLIWPSRR